MSSFGVEAAARHFGLDFVRLLTEDYFFVCRRAFLETEPMQRILEIIRSADFRAAVATLPGTLALAQSQPRVVPEWIYRVFGAGFR